MMRSSKQILISNFFSSRQLKNTQAQASTLSLVHHFFSQQRQVQLAYYMSIIAKWHTKGLYLQHSLYKNMQMLGGRMAKGKDRTGMIIFILAQVISVKIMKNQSYRNLQSTKSLGKFKLESQNRPTQILPLPKRRQENNVYTITTNTTNFSSNKDNSKKEEEYVRRIKVLESELKRRITDDSILRNFFKTKSTAELSHLDLYLEMRKLQESLKQSLEKERLAKLHLLDVQESVQKQEEEHIKHITMLSEQIEEKQQEWRAEKRHLIEENTRNQQQIENNQFLLEEIKKKHAEMVVKLKQANDELEIERQAKVLSELKEKQEHENQLQACLIQLQNQKRANQKLEAQLKHYFNQMNEYAQRAEQEKDEKEKLELRIREFQEVSNDFKESKKEEKEKYQQYYEQLKREYEMEYEKINKDHEQELAKEEMQRRNIINEKNKLEKQLEMKEEELMQCRSKIDCLSQENKRLMERQKNTKDQFQSIEGKAVKQSRQLLQVRYEKDELQQNLLKLNQTLQSKSALIDKIQSRINQLTSINASLQVQCDQFKKQSQVSQSYLKLNNKIYNDNFKTLGRLLEINNKIHTYLNIPKNQEKAINEESLGEVASILTELLEKFIASYNSQTKKYEESVRDRNITSRQTLNLLQQCRQFLNNDYAENLLSKYIALCKERKVSQQSSQEKLEVYHELIQNLMSLNSIKYYHSQHNQQANLKDSLESTYLQRDNESIKKLSRHPLEKTESGKLIRRKERVESEPACDLPLKARLFTEQQNKENVSLNVNKNLFEHRQAKQYISSVRERISSKFTRGQSKQSLDLRSEIEKKYFRS